MWAALEDAADEAGLALDSSPLRTALWHLLTAEPGLRFSLARYRHTRLHPQPSCTHTHVLPAYLRLPAASAPPNPTTTCTSRSEGDLRSATGDHLASVAAAEAAGVRLTATRQLQDAAVGLHDSQLSRFNMSDTQVCAASD